eukprot:1160964-Pelagomonas_calceolata.AAC.6
MSACSTWQVSIHIPLGSICVCECWHCKVIWCGQGTYLCRMASLFWRVMNVCPTHLLEGEPGSSIC